MPTRDQLYNRAYGRAYTKARPLVGAAIRAVNRAIRQNHLPLPSTLSCDDCNRPAALYDHRDYTQPLKVAPVCLSCNAKRGTGHPYIGQAKIVPEGFAPREPRGRPRKARP